MPNASRHRPPTTRMLLNRIYRRQIELERILVDTRAELEILRPSIETTATVARHCRRLVAEKETLMRVIEANRFMSASLPRRSA